MRLLSLCLLAVIPVMVRAQSLSAPIPADAQRAIDQGNAAWVPGLRAQDLDRACVPFTNETLFVDDTGGITRGVQAFKDSLRTRFAKGTKIAGGEVTELGAQLVDGKVVEWGSSFLDMVNNKGIHHRGGGYYLAVWERHPDGSWKISRNIALGRTPQQSNSEK